MQICSFCKNEKEMNKLFHYTNLQPLWASENFNKSNKMSDGSRPRKRNQ